MLYPLLFVLGAWELVEEREGVTIERRVVSESRYHEVRVSARSPLLPAQLADSVWRIRKDGYESRMLKRRDVLFEGPDERVMYEQVKTPIISDRDFTVRLKRLFDDKSGVHQILFHADNAAGPPERTGHVRVQLIRGSWTFEPDDHGTWVTYACLSDPAGSLPPWIARGQQIEAAFTLLREALRFAVTDARR